MGYLLGGTLGGFFHGLYGEGDAEDGSASAWAGATAHTYSPAVAVDDALGEGEAEASSASLLSGEEGAEDLVAVLAGDTVAVVGYGELHFAASFSESKTEDTVVGQRIDGVDDEIGDDLEHLAAGDQGDGVIAKVFNEATFLVPSVR
jgi:hypothetical protein